MIVICVIVFKGMKNPFQFGRELGLGSLVDRKSEVAAVERTIREGNKLFLVGPRRFGKTSILKTAADRLAQESGIVVRLDAESFPSIDELVARIVSSSAKSLGGDAKLVLKLIRKVFSRIKPEMDYNGITGEWSARFGLDSEKLTNPVLIVDALNGFEQLAQSQPEDRPVGLMLDEFQRVIELGGRQLEGQIRAAIQTHSRTGYVFAGSKTQMLHDMVMDKTRPFYRLGTNIFLKTVPRKDFEEFLMKQFTSTGVRAEVSAVNRIMDLSEDVPFNLQQLAHQCWTDLKESNKPGKPVLTDAAVNASLEVLVRQQDPFYAHIWNSLTAIQQRALRAVMMEKGRSMQSGRVVQAIGYSAGTVRQALIAMSSMTVLREDLTADQKIYHFEDPFFASWIRLTTGR
jgi:energy-coupling factor transporter ATP-binding protein EcfA2